jgi:deazaflavin-dependent oxidoreductase (nitroreductase family)
VARSGHPCSNQAMHRLAKLIGALLIALGVLATTFLVGMRSKSPLVLDAVRRTSRAVKPLVLRSAGQPGASTSVIRHVGRRSGTEYQTPIDAVAIDDGFVIALPYGTNTDWLKNVLAGGTATIMKDGETYAVGAPDLVPIAETLHQFPPATQRTLRRFKVNETLRVRGSQPHAEPT